MTKRLNRRQRGAQPGNHNALRHGFYSRNQVIVDRDRLPARAAVKELDHDVALTRATLRRLFAKDPDNLKLIAYTMSLHDRLLRTRQTLIDRDRRAKRRQQRALPHSASYTSPTMSISAGTPTFSLPKSKTTHVEDPARGHESGRRSRIGGRSESGSSFQLHALRER